MESAKEAAAFTNTEAFDDLKKIVCASDVLILTVPDGRIEAVWDSIKAFDIKGKLICHCSGAMTSNIFSGVTEAGAFGYSIHPYVCNQFNDKILQGNAEMFFYRGRC